jgi:hypothetical protein
MSVRTGTEILGRTGTETLGKASIDTTASNATFESAAAAQLGYEPRQRRAASRLLYLAGDRGLSAAQVGYDPRQRRTASMLSYLAGDRGKGGTEGAITSRSMEAEV